MTSAASRRAMRATLTMGPEEFDEFLATQVSCRVATVNPTGPHITGMAFVWDGQNVWVNSNLHTQRLVDIRRDPRVAVHFDELAEPIWLTRFVEILGHAEIVGEEPRVGEPHPDLDAVEKRYADKYGATVLALVHDGSEGPLGGHAWVRITPSKIISKTGSLKAPARTEV